MRLNLDAAQDVIGRKLAKPMGVDLTRAAVGVHDVANEHMATAARIYASEQGVDVRRYALVAFGGAGPVHAYRCQAPPFEHGHLPIGGGCDLFARHVSIP